jgi:hypothetical protein
MAERDLTAAQLAALAANTVRPAVFVEVEVYSGGAAAFVRCWTGVGDYVWDAKTWQGSGRLLGLTIGEESKEVRATSYTVSLSGQPSDLISTALQAVRNNRPVKLWLGLFDAAGALIDTPYPLRRGLSSRPAISDDPSSGTCTIELQVRDRRAALEIPRERRYTDADQAIDYPADQGFAGVDALQDAQFNWPPR